MDSLKEILINDNKKGYFKVSKNKILMVLLRRLGMPNSHGEAPISVESIQEVINAFHALYPC